MNVSKLWNRSNFLSDTRTKYDKRRKALKCASRCFHKDIKCFKWHIKIPWSIFYILTLLATSKEDWNDYIWWMLPWKLTIHRVPADASNVPPAQQRDWIKCINNMHQLLLLWCVNSSTWKGLGISAFRYTQGTEYVLIPKAEKAESSNGYIYIASLLSHFLYRHVSFWRILKMPVGSPAIARVSVTINQFMPSLFHLPAEHCSLC